MFKIVWKVHKCLFFNLSRHICHSGEFPYLATKINARVWWTILSTTPWTVQPAPKPQNIIGLMFSPMKVIDIVWYHIYTYILKWNLVTPAATRSYIRYVTVIHDFAHDYMYMYTKYTYVYIKPGRTWHLHFRRLDSPQSMTSIKCSTRSKHVKMKFSSLQVYSHGNNEYHQLGRETTGPSPIPSQITSIKASEIKKVRFRKSDLLFSFQPVHEQNYCGKKITLAISLTNEANKWTPQPMIVVWYAGLRNVIWP